jgi:two-component system, chemotaxis family, protein-glutamate methylesterase/glutaminase
MQNCLSGPHGAHCSFDLIAVAASLGGPAALGFILSRLPLEFPASVVVVQHISTRSAPLLIEQVRRSSALPVTVAAAGDLPVPGHVYIAPPDHHLVVENDRRLSLNRQPRVKFCRPAAEPLFASVAGTYRERALGLVLTGCNTDGALGVQALKWMGGRVLVQDPATARAPGMPRAAIATRLADYVIPLEMIPAALVALVMAPGVADYLKVWPAVAA